MSLFANRRAGVCLHISSLPGDYGIGDIGLQAQAFVHRLRQMGMSVWQFLPLGPVGYGNSPYQPLSIFAGSEMLIGLDLLVRDGFVDAHDARELQSLPTGTTDYASVAPGKIRSLNKAAERFERCASESQRQAFEQFVHDNDAQWLHDYALFRVLKSVHKDRAWSEWPPEFAQRDPGALADFAQTAATRLHQYKVQQFWFYSQWSELREVAAGQGVALMGDVPIYIALDSSDAWSHPQLLEIDETGQPTCVAGVPPDYFSADGQLWGNPVYDWAYHASTRYAWWVDRIRSAFHQVDLIRLDHFRGFESYWAVPAGATTARDGKWRAGPADDLFQVLKEELGDLPLIAEDLGLITDEVRAFLARWHFPGMKVLQFMVAEPDFRVDQIERQSVCYTGTHDNDTTVGWFQNELASGVSASEHLRRQSHVLDVISGTAETVHLDMIRFALASDAFLCMIPLQDILGLDSKSRMNTPGTTDRNWNWRLDAFESLEQDGLSDTIREMVSNAGRLTQS